MKRKDTFEGASFKKTKLEAAEIVGECVICFEPSAVALPDCGHTFCNVCVIKWFKTMIQTANFKDRICCGNITETMLKEILPKKIFEKYLSAKGLLKQLQRTCYSCQQEIYVPQADVDASFVTCNKCEASMCLNCNKMEHEGECVYTEFDQMLKNLAKENGWAKCPRCAYHVEKSKGCCHTKCRCNAEFCNRCSKPWRQAEGDLAHRHHRCYYCSQVVIGYEFKEEKSSREYSYRVTGIGRPVPRMPKDEVRHFLDEADKWVEAFDPKKVRNRSDAPVYGVIMRKTELRILPGSKKINAVIIEKVKAELKRARVEVLE